MAAWCVRQDGTYGPPFCPTRSIVQGLRAGARFGKCATLFIMYKITTAHANMIHRLWVDDPSQSCKGSRIGMRKQLTSCLLTTCRTFFGAGLEISPKSVVVCSSVQDARAIVRRLKSFGFTMKFAPQAAYLGGDVSGGRRRGRATRTSRAQKHRQMS
eukprot:9321015-Pyramimonas_sp.AAC.1